MLADLAKQADKDSTKVSAIAEINKMMGYVKENTQQVIGLFTQLNQSQVVKTVKNDVAPIMPIVPSNSSDVVV
jgi:hypothetical protein